MAGRPGVDVGSFFLFIWPNLFVQNFLTENGHVINPFFFFSAFLLSVSLSVVSRTWQTGRSVEIGRRADAMAEWSGLVAGADEIGA